MTVLVGDAHVQRLLSVVKMVTVLEKCATEEHRSVVFFFCGQKDSMRRIFIEKCFPFTMGSVCRVERFTNWAATVSLMTKRLKRRCGSG
jgi:hypothetical protein